MGIPDIRFSGEFQYLKDAADLHKLNLEETISLIEEMLAIRMEELMIDIEKGVKGRTSQPHLNLSGDILKIIIRTEELNDLYKNLQEVERTCYSDSDRANKVVRFDIQKNEERWIADNLTEPNEDSPSPIESWQSEGDELAGEIEYLFSNENLNSGIEQAPSSDDPVAEIHLSPSSPEHESGAQTSADQHPDVSDDPPSAGDDLLRVYTTILDDYSEVDKRSGDRPEAVAQRLKQELEQRAALRFRHLMEGKSQAF